MSSLLILEELKSLGSPSIKKVLVNHGAREPFYGVKIDDLKKIQKRVKMDHGLALELYASGVSDAMYLAGLIVDDTKMTQADLQTWVEQANWSLHSESTVPWVAAGSPFGRELALKWIDSDIETIACAGWCTFRSLVGIKPDSDLDIDELRSLLDRVSTTIHTEPNRVRYSMNGFVIAVGTNVSSLTDYAKECGERIGPVSVTMDGTACKVPYAPEYIATAKAKGVIGKKRKTAKC
jgi:3-methyladenine DNA glycosylase AlkD